MKWEKMVPWIVGAGIVYWLTSQPRQATLGQTTVAQLPGAAGVVQTAGFMRAMVNQSIADPLIRKQAAQATDACGRYDLKCKAVAIGEWTRRTIKYVPDPLKHEHLTSPAVMAKAIDQKMRVYGDCDDMSMYTAALAKAIGMQPYFHIVGRNARFHHVYTEAAGISIDPTTSFGVSPFHAKRRAILKV